MNPIEEMMKLYKVKKITIVGDCTNDDYLKCQYKGRCHNCAKARSRRYPYFTSKKQLEIIKLITSLSYKFPDYALRFGKVDNDYCLEREFPTTPEHNRNCYVCTGKNEDFSQALAKLTIELIETRELDKQQVKEILEG